MIQLKVYTDGACFPNPGKGGWAWTVLGKSMEDSGHLDDTTNNVMELMAPIQAIRKLYTPGTGLVIVSDSQYVVKGINEWVTSWEKKDWKIASGSDVKNKELWRELAYLKKISGATFEWIKGNSGDPGNERADHLANQATQADPKVIEECKAFYKNAKKR